MNTQLLHQRVIEAQNQASEWVQQAWEKNFQSDGGASIYDRVAQYDLRESLKEFSPEDFFDLNKLPEISDIKGFWHSISTSSSSYTWEDRSKQVMTVLIEQTAGTFFGFGIGFWLLLLTSFLWMYYMRKWSSKKIKFYCQPTNSVWKELLEKTKLRTMRYKPATLTFNAHLQAICHMILQQYEQNFVKMPYRREIFELSDGGIIGLDWVVHADEQAEVDKTDLSHSDFKIKQKCNRDLVVVVPGLSGDANELYARVIAKKCLKENLDCVFINYRGLAGVMPTTPQLYDAGVTKDQAEVIEYMYQNLCLDQSTGAQVRRITGVGISLGAGVIANMMAHQGDSCRLDACIALACMFDIRGVLQHLRSGLGIAYDYILAAGLVANLKDCVPVFDRLVEKTQPERMVGHLLKDAWRMSYEVNAFVAQAGGYKSVEHYMDATSSTPYLHKVKKPLFILNSIDDPFFGEKVIPIDHRCENVLIGTTKRGGHCSYLTGFWLPTECWWGEPAMEYIKFFNRKCKEDQIAENLRTNNSTPKKMKNSCQLSEFD